jgi:signal transduction histidine kinase
MMSGMGRPETTTTSEDRAPVVRVDALETFVELLTSIDADGSGDSFYSSLCEAVCRLTSMDRAVIFRYDEAHRRVRAAGAYGLDLEVFTRSRVTVESAPIARQALVEDRVIEMDAEAVAREVPESFRDLLGEATLVCCPLSAGGRWSGVILADRRPRRPLSEDERDLLWTLGKTSALAEAARHATFQQARARQLQERIDLAREVHESVIQRLFGVLLVVSSDAPLPAEARERVTVELQAALRDLRRALQRPLGRSAPATESTFAEELERLREAHPELGIELAAGSEEVGVPRALEPLAQSVLVEAVRNAGKHAQPKRVEVTLARQDGAWVMEVCNDGVGESSRTISGMGLRLAVLEALQLGGLVEFGQREPGTWRVRLAVPHERP